MTYVAEIIGIGTELLLGNTANTDAQMLSQKLSELGILVYFHTVVGDNPERIRSAVKAASSRSDIIITTGGLGPTIDDLTKQTVAGCFGKTLFRHQPTIDRIDSFFKNLGTKATENNYQQAMLPEGCTIFENDWGTAPGCAFYADGKHVLMLPGPPRECGMMFSECAVPYLKKLSDGAIVSRNIRIFGMGESAVESRLRDMMEKNLNPTVAPYAKEGEVMLRVTAKAVAEREAYAMMEPLVEEIKKTLGSVIYGIDVDSLEDAVCRKLRDKGLTISAAESCTGGLLSKRLTDIPGSSEVFRGAIVAYANDIKTGLLGVDPEIIRKNGAVCEKTALMMAAGARKACKSELGVGITGVAGPSSSEEKPAGTVFIALSAPNGDYVKNIFSARNDRARIRTLSVNYALDMVRRYLDGIEVVM